MNTMIESMQNELANTNTEAIKTRKASSPREQILTWLIIVASVAVAVQVFRTVALQMEVNRSLDQLYEEAGQALPIKS